MPDYQYITSKKTVNYYMVRYIFFLAIFNTYDNIQIKNEQVNRRYGRI